MNTDKIASELEGKSRETGQAEDRTESLRGMLTEQRRTLTGEIDELLAAHRSELLIHGEQWVADTGDLSIQDAMGDQQLSFLEVRNQMRNQVDEALRRLEEGAYGLCEDCERPIAAERLKAVPFARRCVECQRNVEVIEQIEKEPDREEL